MGQVLGKELLNRSETSFFFGMGTEVHKCDKKYYTAHTAGFPMDCSCIQKDEMYHVKSSDPRCKAFGFIQQ